jgi:hypothetical protein
MSIASEDKVFDAEAIRNTSDHTSAVSEERGFIPKTIIVHNHLNQSVSCQVQGDVVEAFTDPIDVGSPFSVATTVDDYETLTDYFPFLRVVASCSVAPTTGTLTVFIAKVSD